MSEHVVLDASALLALINQEPGGEKVAVLLPNAVMSTINISETASILQNIGIGADQARDLISNLIFEKIPFDEAQAYMAANLKQTTQKFGLSLGDRACLSLGVITRYPVVTADKVWKNVAVDIDVIVIR